MNHSFAGEHSKWLIYEAILPASVGYWCKYSMTVKPGRAFKVKHTCTF